MKNKDYAAYAPDKHGPAAEARKRERVAFIRGLMKKHGVTEAQVYPCSDNWPEPDGYRIGDGGRVISASR